MQWDDLKFFLAVARNGSISAGARRLKVQHSTVSRRIRALENRLGTRLIERKKSGYELTAVGEELKLSAARMELEILDIEDALAGHEGRVCGELRVSAIGNMATTVLMPMFRAFHERYPEIEMHIQVSNRFVSLTERQADIAIRLTNDPLETLIGTRLVTVRSAVYGSAAYLARQRSRAQPPEWLGVECCDFHRDWTHAARPERDFRFYVDDTLLTLAALKEGFGIAYLPCFMGDSHPDLARVHAPEEKHDLGLWLLYHGDLRQTRRVRLFRQHMVDHIAPEKDLFEGRRPAAEHA